MSIIDNEEARAVIKEAVQKLEGMGLKCLISTNVLPHGTTFGLHVGETILDAATGYVAMTFGGSMAHEVDRSREFDHEVAQLIADDAVLKAQSKLD